MHCRSGRANVNCRILPDERVEDVRTALVRAIDDAAVSVTHSYGEPHTPTIRLDQTVVALIAKAASVVSPCRLSLCSRSAVPTASSSGKSASMSTA
jgi:hypothetical protein